MPRRDAPISRQQQAFELLLDQQYAANTTPASVSTQGHRPSKKTHRKVSDKRVPGKLPGFVMRDSLPGACEPTQQSTAQVEQLYSMFGDSIGRSTIKEVLSSCQHSAEAAVDELLAMSEQKQSKETANPSSGKPAPSSGMLSLDLLSCAMRAAGQEQASRRMVK